MNSKETNMLEFAMSFAMDAHSGDVRKYSGIPYVTHPIAVMEILSSVTNDKNILIASLLHDVVEDTDKTIDEIRFLFGDDVASLIFDLTKASDDEHLPRAVRKENYKKHLEMACPRALTIKCADIIHNSSTIISNDPEFAKVWMNEVRNLLPVLKNGNEELFDNVSNLVEWYYDC